MYPVPKTPLMLKMEAVKSVSNAWVSYLSIFKLFRFLYTEIVLKKKPDE